MGQPDLRRNIDDIVDTLRQARERRRGCSLLVGAGCSVTAGIPTAAGFVRNIQQRYQQAFRRAEPKTYPNCMYELAPQERKDLIAEYVDKAQVNWAHICIAQLMKEGYVDRILTTNFDLLVVRACALLGQFPAIYDLAASQRFEPADVPARAVFYLHGQYTGFVLMNTEEEVRKHSAYLEPVFRDAGRGRVWLVIGYSGENDPVFNHLAGVPRFDNNLYWVLRGNDPPPPHVSSRLVQKDRYAFLVNGFDADSLLVTLCQKLGCLPRFIAKPFSHLDDLLSTVATYSIPQYERTTEIPTETRKMVRQAIVQFEESDSGTSIVLLAQQALLEGRYEEVVALGAKVGEQSSEMADAVSWALIRQGDALWDQAKGKKGAESDDWFGQAGDKYRTALQIKPDRHEALNNWALALADQAARKEGRASDRLYRLAGQKLRAALRINPTLPDALFNWAIILEENASRKKTGEARRLLSEAGRKYEAAVRLDPNMVEAYNNWGLMLAGRAARSSGREAGRLFAEAAEKYRNAVRIKPDYLDAWNNWGYLLAQEAAAKSGAAAARLLEGAIQHYQSALRIDQSNTDAWSNWGLALAAQAERAEGKKAEQLFSDAAEKFERALSLKPKGEEILNNIGLVLVSRAMREKGAAATRLIEQACGKYEAALDVQPSDPEILYNWADALVELAVREKGVKALSLLSKAEEKYAAAHSVNPFDPDILNNWSIALDRHAERTKGAESARLRKLSGGKYAAARKLVG